MPAAIEVVPEAIDAVVVGSGPNGLSAAVEIARAGRSVVVVEAAEEIGGGTRTAELTLPGFRHDLCSAIHPMGAGSPYLRTLPLAHHGLEWIHPDVPLAHPLDDASAVLLHRSIDETARGLGCDGPRYRRLMERFASHAEELISGFLGPLLRPPRHPFVMASFGWYGLRSADRLIASFEEPRTKAMLAGNAAHAMLPLSCAMTGAFALVYNVFAHHVGWPIARGGSQAISNALASYLRSLGGTIECGRRISSLRELPPSRVVLLDLAPRSVLEIASAELPPRYARRLARFRYGPGVFKIDWALAGPIPWKDPVCSRAGCLHLGGGYEAIAASERAVASGAHPEDPWVIVAQPSVFDSTRAPPQRHTGWAYTHVPAGSSVDMTDRIERQVERFAPGFRDLVIGRNVRTAVDLERYNANYVGGDIGSGATSFAQMIGRPVLGLHPHATPNERIFLCSQSTPPGPGVHGMCGYYAARAALRRLR